MLAISLTICWKMKTRAEKIQMMEKIDGENRRDEEVKLLNTANDVITESRELEEESMNESECSTLQNI